MMVVSLPVNVSIWSSGEIASSEIDLGRTNRVIPHTGQPHCEKLSVRRTEHASSAPPESSQGAYAAVRNSESLGSFIMNGLPGARTGPRKLAKRPREMAFRRPKPPLTATIAHCTEAALRSRCADAEAIDAGTFPSFAGMRARIDWSTGRIPSRARPVGSVHPDSCRCIL